MGSVIKKRRKRMAKKKHRKLLKKTRIQRRNKKQPAGTADLAGAPAACPRSPPRETATYPVGRSPLASACEPVAHGRMKRIVGDTLAAVAGLADNGRRGSPIPRSERI